MPHWLLCLLLFTSILPLYCLFSELVPNKKVSNCSNPKAGPSVNRALISSDHGATWEVGGPTPTMVDGQLKSWGESMVAELANGSVVLTSRMGDALSASSRCMCTTFLVLLFRSFTHALVLRTTTRGWVVLAWAAATLEICTASGLFFQH